jgi:hypothetical protein
MQNAAKFFYTVAFLSAFTAGCSTLWLFIHIYSPEPSISILQITGYVLFANLVLMIGSGTMTNIITQDKIGKNALKCDWDDLCKIN